MTCKNRDSKNTIYDRGDYPDGTYAWNFECKDCGFEESDYEF